ncbi:hypothetical protein [Metaclostridioides mangenotii]|uniref:hypothetical protein n=1 Tax=Metaclostridioides mangenotii TaxID=1540 RepID=UPI002F40A49C
MIPRFPELDQLHRYVNEKYILDGESTKPFGDGETIANQIRDRVKKELWFTASIVVSFNKVFEKLGSDMKKPDATTVILKDMVNIFYKYFPFFLYLFKFE